MKVIDAETQFDGNRVTFYFTADHRVDFRELVRDLASIFRTRIELRQVGARDAARRCDGIGPCGRPLCCTTFLREFEPVTLKMAKEQNLALNPAKISGTCGRLMCCLTYECAGLPAGAAARRPRARHRAGHYQGRRERPCACATWATTASSLEDARRSQRESVDLDRLRPARAPISAAPTGRSHARRRGTAPAPGDDPDRRRHADPRTG